MNNYNISKSFSMPELIGTPSLRSAHNFTNYYWLPKWSNLKLEGSESGGDMDVNFGPYKNTNTCTYP